MEQVIQGYSTHAGMNEWENPHGQNTQVSQGRIRV